jgi:tetratricopeptide (TPR) repeat protein/predicted Ser/Thr protein kinase
MMLAITSMSLSPGTRVQHYLVQGPLGAGGMGAVYRAEDSRLGRHVALKFLQAGEAERPDVRARLLREARAASSLKSSGIAAIYDIGEHEGQVFIVMELVEGEPLSARVARGPLPVREVVDLGAQVADALDAAHTAGVIHRDIKSANLMLDPRGRVKVLDFGLAKFVPPPGGSSDGDMTRRASLETRAGTILGTFAYMAPEQALGRTVDHRADLFSLGVVLYELLTGRLPFGGLTTIETVEQLLNADPPAIGRFTYGVPDALERAVLKLLTKTPEFRYQSARELYIDLTGIGRQMDGRSTVAGDLTLRGMRSTITDGLPRPRTQARTVAVSTFANLTREPADEWIGSGIAETVTADLKNVKGISVIGRAQVFDAQRSMEAAGDAAGDDKATLEIGRRIGATWIVAGAFQRLGSTVRITAQFLDVASGEVLRTVKVDGQTDQIFDLQDRIVFELSQGLDLALDPSDIVAIQRDETKSVEAYESYSRGMMNLRLATRESIDRAIAQFERAVERDPEYAEAWVGLGRTLNLKGQFLSIPELALRAVECHQRAIAIDPRLASAHHLLGSAYLALKRYDEAVAAVRESLRLDANNAGAHEMLGRILWFGKGDFEAGIAELEVGASLNPEGGYTFLQLALLHALRGETRLAEAAARRAIDLQERFVSGTEGLQIVGAHLRLGYVLYRQERYDEAIREFELELAFVSSGDHMLRSRALIETHQKLAAAYWRKGDRPAADREFQRALTGFTTRVASGADDGATEYYVAAMHALRGDAETAGRHLREAIALLPGLNPARARVDPDFDPVRDDPAISILLANR